MALFRCCGGFFYPAVELFLVGFDPAVGLCIDIGF